MKMIRRMIAIIIVTFVFLFVAMLMMKVIRHGGDFTTALMEELQRETAKWNHMRSPENLRAVLLANGIAMNVPSPRQRVAMRGPGARPSGAPAVATGTAYAANR